MIQCMLNHAGLCEFSLMVDVYYKYHDLFKHLLITNAKILPIILLILLYFGIGECSCLDRAINCGAICFTYSCVKSS